MCVSDRSLLHISISAQSCRSSHGLSGRRFLHFSLNLPFHQAARVASQWLQSFPHLTALISLTSAKLPSFNQCLQQGEELCSLSLSPHADVDFPLIPTALLSIPLCVPLRCHFCLPPFTSLQAFLCSSLPLLASRPLPIASPLFSQKTK